MKARKRRGSHGAKGITLWRRWPREAAKTKDGGTLVTAGKVGEWEVGLLRGLHGIGVAWSCALRALVRGGWAKYNKRNQS